MLLATESAAAATLTVNTTRDEITSGDGLCSLREAIQAVNSPGSPSDCAPASVGANTIVLGAQSYLLGPPAPQAELSIAGSVRGLTIEGAGEARTTVDASALNNRILEVAPGGVVTIQDLTLTGGRAPAGAGGPGGPATSTAGGSGGLGGFGGAIYSTGTLVLNGLTLAGNHAGDGGEGAAGATRTSAAGGDGGSGGYGGAITENGGTLQVTGSTFSGNSAGNGGNGGAGGTGGSSSGGPAPVVGGNGGDAGMGGSGGAISRTGAGEASLLSATLAGNSIGFAGSPGARGTGGGGNGAYGHNAAGGAGGGIYAHGISTWLRSTLLASNAGGNCSDGILDGGDNLSFGDFTCINFATDDPRLGPLQDNGGPTKTMALRPGSAAINQVPPGGPGCPGTDQRGVARPAPAGGQCDIGAYEVAAPRLTIRHVKAKGTRSVVIKVTVTADASTATVRAEYGRSRSLGRRTVAHTIHGVMPVAVSFTLRGLDLRQPSYYVRLVATSADGVTKSRELKLCRPRMDPPIRRGARSGSFPGPGAGIVGGRSGRAVR